ncbi:MAG: zf-TFIIB domain-containing protein [Solirubrobacterales bacterium]|nr:zf-TFIIB domain-containing protein [Solirubrobacterales bacterium]
MTETTMSCPKCGSDMRSYERNGVVVDQCTGCGGLFLDRGELERLAQAESSFYGGDTGGQRSAPPQPSGGPGPAPSHGSHQHSSGYGSGYSSKHKRKNFLEELFG